ncbi:MAG: SDR family NAD(P)-dependent oxidoreductase, partial [Planctomycetota bacterium]
MEFKLENQIVIVTGASKGIGAGIAKELALAGATVVLCARNQEQLEALGHEIEKEGGLAHVYRLDISS